MRALFLLLDLSAISIPLAFSFHPRIALFSQGRAVWIALLAPALVFLAWDMIFTRIGVWGFSSAYTLGVNVVNLPLEEALFFLCIPFACLFTYVALSRLLPFRGTWAVGRYGAYVVLGACAVGLLGGLPRLYPTVTFAGLGLLMAYLVFVRRADYLGMFFVAYGCILLPFFVVNGVLTGTGIPGQVVWYNPGEMLNVRIGSIPLEDAFYGMLLLLSNVALYERVRGPSGARRLE